MRTVNHGIDRIRATFDDESMVADAGLVLVATLVARLSLETLIDKALRLAGRVGGARPGRKVLTLVHAMIGGAVCIDDADRLRAGAAWALDRQHRAHAVVELSIRDLKAGPLTHLPSGSFHANGAWLQFAVLAHNLIRWTAALGHITADQFAVAKTFRYHHLSVPGRLVNRSGRQTLRLPAR